jgi:hypothetical protein
MNINPFQLQENSNSPLLQHHPFITTPITPIPTRNGFAATIIFTYLTAASLLRKSIKPSLLTTSKRAFNSNSEVCSSEK